MIQINLISLTKKERNVKIATIDTETNKLYCVEFTEKEFLKMLRTHLNLMTKNRMSQKHFEKISELIRCNTSLKTGEIDARILSVALSNYFEKENPKFKRGLFLKMCGVA